MANALSQETQMVQRIDRLYEQNRVLKRQQEEAVQHKSDELASEERSDGRVRRENIAERIAPHLHDEVQISDEAREVSRAEQVGHLPTDTPVSEDTLRQLSDSWYATGYQQAMDQIESE
jgi:hypothetical protein